MWKIDKSENHSTTAKPSSTPDAAVTTTVNPSPASGNTVTTTAPNDDRGFKGLVNKLKGKFKEWKDKWNNRTGRGGKKGWGHVKKENKTFKGSYVFDNCQELISLVSVTFTVKG